MAAPRIHPLSDRRGRFGPAASQAGRARARPRARRSPSSLKVLLALALGTGPRTRGDGAGGRAPDRSGGGAGRTLGAVAESRHDGDRPLRARRLRPIGPGPGGGRRGPAVPGHGRSDRSGAERPGAATGSPGARSRRGSGASASRSATVASPTPRSGVAGFNLRRGAAEQRGRVRDRGRRHGAGRKLASRAGRELRPRAASLRDAARNRPRPSSTRAVSRRSSPKAATSERARRPGPALAARGSVDRGAGPHRIGADPARRRAA